MQVGEVTCPLPAQGTDANETCHYPSFAKAFDAVGINGEGKQSDFDRIWPEKTRVARLRAQAEAARGFSIGGVGTATQFVPGFKFTLDHHGSDNGEYLLTRVIHRARGASPDSGEDDDEIAYGNDFECIPYAVQYRPARRIPRP